MTRVRLSTYATKLDKTVIAVQACLVTFQIGWLVWRFSAADFYWPVWTALLVSFTATAVTWWMLHRTWRYRSRRAARNEQWVHDTLLAFASVPVGEYWPDASRWKPDLDSETG